jgi:hypothetical protein
VASGWPVPYLPLRPVASTASDCVVSAGPASFRIVVAPSSSLAVGSGFHLDRLRLVVSRQRLAVRVYIIGQGIKCQQVFGERCGSFSEKPGGQFLPARERARLPRQAQLRTIASTQETRRRSFEPQAPW